MMLGGLLGLAAAFLLGAMHALTPGHGKTVVGAYLIGTRGRAIDAISLGVIVTLAHTGGVVALGLVAVVASAYFVPQQIDRVLALVAGLLVVAVGGWILSEPLRIRRDRAIRSRLPGYREAGQGHGQHGHAHHGPAHCHHDEHGHHHHAATARRSDAGPPSLSMILTLGLSGGIIPCPAALAVLLASVASGTLAEGLIWVIAFSLGLAAVLIGIGLALVNAGRAAARWLPLEAHAAALRWASGLVILGLGGYLTIQAIRALTAA